MFIIGFIVGFLLVAGTIALATATLWLAGMLIGLVLGFGRLLLGRGR